MFLNEQHIFSFNELLDIYDKYLHPFLGVIGHTVDKELIIMNEISELAEWNTPEDQPTISKVLMGVNVPTDIVNNFKHKFNDRAYTLLEHLNTNIDYVLYNPGDIGRRFTAHLEIRSGYIVVLSARIYNVNPTPSIEIIGYRNGTSN